jgi:hypothetical protein
MDKGAIQLGKVVYAQNQPRGKERPVWHQKPFLQNPSPLVLSRPIAPCPPFLVPKVETTAEMPTRDLVQALREAEHLLEELQLCGIL